MIYLAIILICQTYNDEQKKMAIFKELVYNKDKILKEQERIKEEIEYEKYQQKRLEELQLKKNGNINNISPLHYSKYPISRQIYESNKKMKDNLKSLIINKNNNNNDSDNPLYNQIVQDSSDNNNDILSKTNNENYDNKLFLEAYKRIIIQNEKKKKEKKRTMSCKITKRNFYEIKYIHPGIFRQFNYIMNLGNYNNKQEKYMAWSCCNNKDRKSKGCQKTYVKKEKNFGFP